MLGRDWLLIAALGGCLSLGAWTPWPLKADAPQSASGEAKPETAEGDQSADHAVTTPSEAGSAPVEAKVAAQPTESGLESDDAKEVEKGTPWTDWWVAVITIVMAIFTGVLTVVGVFQLVLLFRSNSETKDALNISRAAAEAATKSAAAAAEANAINRDAAYRQTRAYVHLARIECRPNVSGSTEIQPVWQNVGRTPTLGALAQNNFSLAPTGIPDDFDFPDTNTAGDPYPNSLGAGQTLAVRGPTVSSHDWGEIREGRLVCDVWGWIEYNDVLDDVVRHRAEYSARLYIQSGNNGGDGFWYFLNHAEHNGAEHDCFHTPKT